MRTFGITDRLLSNPVRTLVVTALAVLVTAESSAQPGHLAMTESSEWEATAFNNGRRIVRDANGYFHAFWHSRDDLPEGPSGTGAHIYYSYTTLPADEPPSMAFQGAWSTPVCMTSEFFSEWPFEDHRYPSAAIEYHIYDGEWQDVNTIHVVWQGLIGEVEGTPVDRYEVLYASIPVANPPTPPAPFGFVDQLSWTWTDSLVPSIAINRYWIDEETLQQNIHVVWQEEDINDGGDDNLFGDDRFSDIAYIRSTNSGWTWEGPAGGWGGYVWDNITETAANSQMPSVSCILDQFTGHPAELGRDELGYNTNTVHVAYHEDVDVGDPTMTEIHIFYQKSPDNGETWPVLIDVTLAAAIPDSNPKTEAYPSLAVDMLDRPHIAWMYNNLVSAEPLRQGVVGDDYLAGINPTEPRSFPGPNPGMYGAANNMIAAYYYDDGMWVGETMGIMDGDNEFPTISLDRWMHINVTYQSWNGFYYDIHRYTRINLTPPSWPLAKPVYADWNPDMSFNVSNDSGNDDLFPNLAHKRVSLYASPDELIVAGYDEVWTKVQGTGAEAAVNPALMRQIWQDGNMTWEDPTPPMMAEMELWNEDETLQITNNAPANAAAGTDYGLVVVGKSEINRFIIKNTGPVTLDITGVGIGGDHPGDFQVLGWPAFLNPTEEAGIDIEFQPTAYADRFATIDIENNTAEDPFVLHVAGVGAYEHVGTAGPGGSIDPEGETPVESGGTIEYVIQADADYHIYSCTTNGAEMIGLAGLLNYTVVWANVTADGATDVQFTDETATNNTSIPWLRRFYTNEVDWDALAARAAQDTDGDGFLGWQEHVAETDPTDSNSFFRVTDIQQGSPFTVTFDPSSGDRVYTLLYTEDLVDGPWTNVPDQYRISGGPAADSLTDTNAAPGRAYGIVVEIP